MQHRHMDTNTIYNYTKTQHGVIELITHVRKNPTQHRYIFTDRNNKINVLFWLYSHTLINFDIYNRINSTIKYINNGYKKKTLRAKKRWYFLFPVSAKHLWSYHYELKQNDLLLVVAVVIVIVLITVVWRRCLWCTCSCSCFLFRIKADNASKLHTAC